MGRYRHPVLGSDLLGTPEMALRHPAERAETASVHHYDEANGCGYDNGSADAYAERWVDVDEGATAVLTWFASQFGQLGWTARSPVPTTGVAYLGFLRDPDERAGVLLQGFGDWQRHEDRAVNRARGPNRLRLHLAVDGTFADGSAGFHVG